MKPTRELVDKVFSGTKAERKYLCEKRFDLFFIYYFGHYIKYPTADFQWDMDSDIDDLIDGSEITELGWFAFRESTKTSRAKAFIVRNIAYSTSKYINVDSQTQANSEQILFDVVKELQSNKKIIADFGNLYNEQRVATEKTKKRITDFITTNDIRVEAHTTQQDVRGRTYGEYRPDLLIIDDFENDTTVNSQAAMEEVFRHLKTFYGGLAPRHRILYLGNYLTEYGVVQSLMERSKTDTKLRVRMIPVAEEMYGKINWPGKYVWTNKEASELNKERKDKDNPIVSLEAKLDQMKDGFYAEMMNMPVDYSNAEFKKEWFKYAKLEDVDRLITNCYVTIDTAVSQRDSADFTGVCITWIDLDGKRYVKVYRLKINSAEVINHLFELNSKYKPIKFGIEEGTYNLTIKPFLDEEMRKRNTFLYIETLKHNGTKKEARARGLIPLYTSGSIYHLDGNNTDFEGELLRFPNGKHDDMIDALSYSIDFVHKPYKEEEYVVDDEPQYADIGI